MENSKKRYRKRLPKKAAQRVGAVRPLLTLGDRTTIEIRYCTDGWTLEKVGEAIGRHKGTISRELGGKTRKGVNRYRADVAHKKACERIEARGNVRKLDESPPLYAYVTAKLREYWSPEQISNRLVLDYPNDETMRISYEAIYQFVYEQIASSGKPREGCEDFRQNLPRRHARRATKGARKAQKLERLESLPSIETRPVVVQERARVGDWEDDLLVSRESESQVKSVNERKTGVFFFRKTASRTAADGDAQVVACLETIPQEFRLTLTRDRGPENKAYIDLQKKLGLSVYFAHPYCSHERGSNENGNGLLRRFFPKKTNWNDVSDEELLRAEYLINTRPRKRYGYRSPAEMFLLETGVALYS